MADVQLNSRGPSISQALLAENAAARDVHVLGLVADIVANGQLVAKKSDGSGMEGVDLVEEVPADPDDVAAGTDTVLGVTIASHQFWRMQQVVSIADSSPFNIRLIGTSTTPGSANHTCNILMNDVNAAVTWQVQDIASGLEGVEGKIIFENTGASARNCFPQNHATSGASVRYADGVVQGDLILPTGSGSRLTVYYEVITDGATGVIEISGFKKRTA